MMGIKIREDGHELSKKELFEGTYKRVRGLNNELNLVTVENLEYYLDFWGYN